MKVYSVYGSYIKNGSKWHTLETTTGGDLEDVLDNIEKRLENDNEYKKDSFTMILNDSITIKKIASEIEKIEDNKNSENIAIGKLKSFDDLIKQ